MKDQQKPPPDLGNDARDFLTEICDMTKEEKLLLLQMWKELNRREVS